MRPATVKVSGERLVGRVDVKAERKQGRILIPARHHETERKEDRVAVDVALKRYGDALGLTV